MVKHYQEEEGNDKVVFASSRGSMNYGLYQAGVSDYDSLMLALPSWDRLIMGDMIANQHIESKEDSLDIYVMDFRNIEKLFLKPSFAKLQMIWAVDRYSHLGNDLEKWLIQESLPMLQDNVKALALSALGRLRAEQKKGLTDKELSLHIYNLRLLEVLISKNEIDFAEFKELATTLGNSLYPGTFVSLYDLKYQGTERAFFEKELTRSKDLIESVLEDLPIMKNGSKRLDNLRTVVADTTYNYLQSYFIQ